MGGYAGFDAGNGRVTLKAAMIGLGLAAASAPALAVPSAEPSAQASAAQLGPNARARYQEIFAAIRNGQWVDVQAKIDAMPEGPLHNVARAELYLAKGSPKVEAQLLADLAAKAPELPAAPKLMALAQSRGVSAPVALPVQQTLTWLGTAPRRGKVAGDRKSVV